MDGSNGSHGSDHSTSKCFRQGEAYHEVNSITENEPLQLPVAYSELEYSRVLTDEDAAQHCSELDNQHQEHTLPLTSDSVFPAGSSVSMESAQPPSDNVQLIQACPSAELPKNCPNDVLTSLSDFRSKTTVPATEGWSIPSYWPPRMPPYKQSFERPDIVPPKDASLEVHIQAYALRWGHWAALIENDQRREEVLRWVTERMQQAWENAIKEGVYPHPDLSKLDSNQRRGRRRDISPSKQSAGFACEGKDKFAVTYSELDEAGVTMDEINEKIRFQDFDAAELFLDEILVELDRDIEIRDWSINPWTPTVRNRNLLMYCLYVVQQSRSMIRKFRWLLKKFQKDSQKRNTQNRIDIQTERVEQHLALAAILRLKNPSQNDLSQVKDDNSQESADISLNHAPEQHSDIDQVIGYECITEDLCSFDESASNRLFSSSDDDRLMAAARAVLAARSQDELKSAFGSQHVTKDELRVANVRAATDEPSQQLIIVKSQLRAIWDQITRITELEVNINQQRKPRDLIKLTKQKDLAKLYIVKHQNILRVALDDPAAVGSLMEPEQSGSEGFIGHPGYNYHKDDEVSKSSGKCMGNEDGNDKDLQIPGAETITKYIDHTALEGQYISNLRTPEASVPEKGGSLQANDKTQAQNPSYGVGSAKTEASKAMPPIIATIGSSEEHLHTKEDLTTQTPNFDSLRIGSLSYQPDLKQEYTNEIWLPKINSLLLQNNETPLWPGKLDKWKGIKELLMYLNIDSAGRNRYLRDYKSGYETWLQQRSNSTVPQVPTDYEWIDPWFQDLSSAPFSEAIKANDNKLSANQLPNTVAPSSIILKFPNKLMNKPVTTMINEQPSLLLRLPNSTTQPQDFGEYSSKIVMHTAHGFSYRFSPYATLKQRKGIEDLIHSYSDLIAGTSHPRSDEDNSQDGNDSVTALEGDFVDFVDPVAEGDQRNLEVAYGFWDLGKSKDALRRRYGIAADWFFSGGEKPLGWGVKVEDGGGEVAAGKDRSTSSTREMKRDLASAMEVSRDSERAAKKRKTGLINDEDGDGDYMP